MKGSDNHKKNTNIDRELGKPQKLLSKNITPKISPKTIQHINIIIPDKKLLIELGLKYIMLALDIFIKYFKS